MRKQPQRIWAVAALGAATLVVPLSTPAIAATSCPPAIINLGVASGASGGEVAAFNQRGLFVGDSRYPTLGAETPTLWQRTGARSFRITNLGFMGTLGGYAGDVNENGEVVIALFTNAGGVSFWYHNGVRHRLLGLDGRTVGVSVRRINQSGQMAGTALDSHGVPHPVMWPSWRAAPVALPLPAGTVAGSGSGINDAGEVVGDVFRLHGYQYGVRWLHGRILGRLRAVSGGDGETAAFVVNDQERVAEESTFNADQVPEAAVVDLNTRPRGLGIFAGYDASAPFGISPGGRIAGQNFRFDHTAFRALYWPGHGPTKTLMPIGGKYAHESSNAHAVDDYGNVAGWSSPRPSSDPLTIVTTDLVPTLWTCADRQAFVPSALATSR